MWGRAVLRNYLTTKDTKTTKTKKTSVRGAILEPLDLRSQAFHRTRRHNRLGGRGGLGVLGG
jgi:hypothetical protein